MTPYYERTPHLMSETAADDLVAIADAVDVLRQSPAGSDALTPEREAEILRFAPSEAEVSTATLDAVLLAARDGRRAAPFLRAGDVVSIGGRPVVVCAVGAPYRDADGVRRVVVTGTGEGARTVATPVRLADEFELVTFP